MLNHTQRFRLATVAYTAYALILSSMFVFAQRPGEVTRGPAREPEQLPPINLPTPIQTSSPIDSWGELAAMLTVITIVMGVVQYLVNKLMIAPELERQLVNSREWASKTFPSKVEFDSHIRDDQVNAKYLAERLIGIVEEQAEDHDRVSILQLDVGLLKNRVDLQAESIREVKRNNHEKEG